MMDEVNKNLAHYREMRQTHLDNAVAPPLYFNPVVPGMQFERRARPFRMSAPPAVTPPRQFGRRGLLARRASGAFD